ncbi:MAG: histidine phosphatase family protein [Ilumatobacteraceae bacterium]
MDDPAFGELVLVRHAQQGLNDLGDPSRPKAGDAPLSERGLAQAEATADVLAIEPVHHVYASDLRRARMTAAAIAARHGLEPIIDPRLREVDVFRGIPKGSTVAETLGPDALATIREEFARTRSWAAFPLTETIEELDERLGSAIADINARHPESDRIVIVSHGGALNIVVRRVLGTEAHMTFFPNHASITRIGRGRGQLVMRTMNESAHLLVPGAGRTF